MQLPIQGEVYFTLQQHSESISSVIVANGTVIARGPSLQERPPENWISALREMSERLGRDKDDGIPKGYSTEASPTTFGSSPRQSPTSSELFTSPTPSLTKSDLGLKRMKKLQDLLAALFNHPISSVEDHNQQVEGLYSGSRITTCPNVSIMQFAEVLGRLGNVSNTVGNVYGLLSWQIFKMEEDRLVHDEGLSPNFAAKQMNKKMAEVLKRRGKAKDWASDARRAVTMVFGPLRNTSICVRSFALILLASLCSLDGLLKIAHFPTLRRYFEEQFSRIVESQAPEWELLEESGYKVFDYKEFLRQRGPPLPLNDQSHNLPLDRLLEWRAQVSMSPAERLFANSVETGSASTARPSGMVNHTGNMPPQPQLQLPGTSPEASTMDYLFQNLTNCDEMVNLELVI
ncbi:uncharacterized protein ASPGLDRAFT_45739 [Aspergillus glaucus CBS 516.65]|uniref:Uncharacterized protein n=1 Tax=Aspergillus glaucus CBS 516.65 TaxID=1160497 RepID=A0A1L9VP72_ASPGL|nr:hypothetical protein ASPGLDRAFT_45739 [Aspergillus glaucus CBS 516.65]OJJ85725.1 hypothetical protein ASPGLDRAFT_45739 [Aspergillus glaucus CBS 516.65]